MGVIDVWKDFCKTDTYKTAYRNAGSTPYAGEAMLIAFNAAFEYASGVRAMQEDLPEPADPSGDTGMKEPDETDA